MSTDDDAEDRPRHEESEEEPQRGDEDPLVVRGESAGLLERPAPHAVPQARAEWSADAEALPQPLDALLPADSGTAAVSAAPFDFIEFMQTNRSALLRQMRRICCGDTELAEDVVQMTFLAAHKRCEQLAQHPHPVGWLYTVATNAAVTLLQREHLGRRKHTEAAHTEAVGRTGAGYGSLLDLVEELGDLRERQVITLTYFYGYSRKEIAAALGISVRTVTSVKSKALQRLKSLLTEEGDH
ncbi:RNA polymerase sigma factor [Nocardia sp. NPDC059240]|uniref:RNA polymerase sigma factor n=1 Tax=Nocardia sp. NPDC059240 TaxID=3346786 RepID=UPI0036BFA00B